MHAWHDIPLRDDKLETFPIVIEIPQGTKNKYELDKETGFLRLDRVLFSSMRYPTNYGFIPRTYAEDDDPLDALVLGQEPVPPLAYLEARAIGGFEMSDEHGRDFKVICVHIHDPLFSDYCDISQLPRHLMTEIKRFFEDYKLLENKGSDVGATATRVQAMDVIADAVARYNEKFGARETAPRQAGAWH